MYLNRFGLSRMPFEISPDPAFFFASSMHRHALAMLEYAIVAGSELCLVTGPVGSGKTTLVQCLLARCVPDRRRWYVDGGEVPPLHGVRRSGTQARPPRRANRR